METPATTAPAAPPAPIRGAYRGRGGPPGRGGIYEGRGG